MAWEVRVAKSVLDVVQLHVAGLPKLEIVPDESTVEQAMLPVVDPAWFVSTEKVMLTVPAESDSVAASSTGGVQVVVGVVVTGAFDGC